jgi:two-component system, NtrC family, sensor kinase
MPDYPYKIFVITTIKFSLNFMKRTMKLFLKTSLLLLLPLFGKTQNMMYEFPTNQQADSFRLLLQKTNNDTVKMFSYIGLGSYYAERNRDTSLYYFEKAFPFAHNLNQKIWEAVIINGMSHVIMWFQYNYPKALQMLFDALKLVESIEVEKNIIQVNKISKEEDAHKAHLYVLAGLHNGIATVYYIAQNQEKFYESNNKSIQIAESINDRATLAYNYAIMGYNYIDTGKFDEALLISKKAVEFSKNTSFESYVGLPISIIGDAYFQKGDVISAKMYYLEAIKVNKKNRYLESENLAYISLSLLYNTTNQSDSSLFYGKKALEIARAFSPLRVSWVYRELSNAYKLQNKTDSAFKFLQLSKVVSDSLNAIEKIRLTQYQVLDFAKLTALQEEKQNTMQLESKRKIYGLLGGLGLFSIIGLFLYHNNQQKQKANEVLQHQKEEIENQKNKVESTLQILKTTQTQLIQKEKLASLGELTAGIAHEIQNPLNFVNNFSELSVDLAKDLKEEIHKPDIDKEYVEELLTDLSQNQEKINHHGKRASSIVKGMLEHSRASTGVKEMTDINALADEYFRLSYHGLRAKDKDFNATMETDFDKNLPKINLIPQDMGRVLLNLFNNAFYAVHQRQQLSESLKLSESYTPAVFLTTQLIDNQIVIKVNDNGLGMPESVRAKVFQPFFTTKPTGSGTGLGLSLAYDIVTKGHGGALEVISTEGYSSEFTIQLPI